MTPHEVVDELLDRSGHLPVVTRRTQDNGIVVGQIVGIMASTGLHSVATSA